MEIFLSHEEYLCTFTEVFISPYKLQLLLSLENNEVHSSSIDKYVRSFIYLPLQENNLLNYINLNG